MKKGVFFLGLILLLAGIIFARPIDTRNTIDRINNDDIHDNLIDTYNSTYGGIEDTLGENTDVVSFGAAMVGVLLMIMSIIKKKEKVAGLLYQDEEKQNISPHLLETSITQPHHFKNSSPQHNSSNGSSHTVTGPSNTHASSSHSGQAPIHQPHQTHNDNFELPDLDRKSTSVVTKNPEGGKHIVTTTSDSGVRKREKHGNRGESSNTLMKESSGSMEDMAKESSLCCPNCGQGFSLKGSIRDVICPRCGKRFKTKKLKKS